MLTLLVIFTGLVLTALLIKEFVHPKGLECSGSCAIILTVFLFALVSTILVIEFSDYMSLKTVDRQIEVLENSSTTMKAEMVEIQNSCSRKTDLADYSGILVENQKNILKLKNKKLKASTLLFIICIYIYMLTRKTNHFSG